MKKGVFSMYATKSKHPTFFIQEYSYPNHKETELSVHITNNMAHDISTDMIHCARGIIRVVAQQSKSITTKKL